MKLFVSSLGRNESELSFRFLAIRNEVMHLTLGEDSVR